MPDISDLRTIASICKYIDNPASIRGALIAIIHIYGIISLAKQYAGCIINSMRTSITASLLAGHLTSEGQKLRGGSRTGNISYTVMSKYLSHLDFQRPLTKCKFHFEGHIKCTELIKYDLEEQFIHVRIPLPDLGCLLTVRDGREVAKLHGISLQSHASKAMIQSSFLEHYCKTCPDYISLFTLVSPSQHQTIRKKTRLRVHQHRQKMLPATCNQMTTETSDITEMLLDKHIEDFMDTKSILFDNSSDNEQLSEGFPPAPLSFSTTHRVISSASQHMEPACFEESGCAVCGQLTLRSKLVPLQTIQNPQLSVLSTPGITRKVRQSVLDPISEYPHALDYECNMICDGCSSALLKGKAPQHALAKGLWVGPIPHELSSLRFVEKLLIARVRHSACAIKVAMGMRKMKANVIAFESPTAQIYDILPPARADIEQVLAILFTGPCKPTQEDMKRTPFLIRRNKVKLALQWLILNHTDYAYIKISDQHLMEYPEDYPPVSIQYRLQSSNKTAEGMSLFDNEDEDGTETGDCSFTVHGITGEELTTLSSNAIKAQALQHLNLGHKVLAVGHRKDPEPLWNNPQLYPRMFPWLFPYGLGGIGTIHGLSDQEHKRRLLMYHDKRFQMDPMFPFVAFSHQQIKTSTSNSFLLAKKSSFTDIAQRILQLDMNALKGLLQKMSAEQHINSPTPEEKICFQILSDLDHVTGTMKGSATSKKWMRNEIWSLVAHFGAPFWYITLSPADIKHPICIYHAGTNENFSPHILPYDERLHLICNNPVAGARFFHYLITIFIQDVLGYGQQESGLFGPINAFYGTVEQQGRLTLHLHMLLWLTGNLTPQNMRVQLLDPSSNFQQKLVAWIESCQIGEFITGTMQEVRDTISQSSTAECYNNPTEILPKAPPPLCPLLCQTCDLCLQTKNWQAEYSHIIDDIILKSNVHNCNIGSSQSTFKRCKDNASGTCKARFPRATYDCTEVDPETGALNLKKKEAWINSISPAMTYLFRCNTDVTCMWSGTALKAVIIYISDYITKTGLKTHVMFDTIKGIFENHSDILNASLSTEEKARQILCKIANLLATKTELGGPMICLYLLGQPDHYSSHEFVTLNWRIYVTEALSHWKPTDDQSHSAKVTLRMVNGKLVPVSLAYDYMYRPKELELLSLYNWARRSHKVPLHIKHSSDSSKTKPSLPKNTYRFLTQHPLYDSHACMTFPHYKNHVVNFIGGVLPRAHHDDREAYCSAMLVFFKPWRSGLDLKHPSQNWEEAFETYQFSPRSEQIMKNFNIRYECLDARDDYQAQRKKDNNQSSTNLWNNDCEPSDDHLPNDLDVIGEQIDFSASDSHENLNKDTAHIRSILNFTGWNDHSPTDNNCFAQTPYVPPMCFSSQQWKALIQKEKNLAINKKALPQSNLPTISPHINYDNSDPNQIKIIDRWFLQKKFYTQPALMFTTPIATLFQLNEDQTRAFNIITQHALIPPSKQLTFYIGGMGGTGKTRVINAISHFFTQSGQPNRFITMAPTGTAAALLSGSTYHSLLGINDYQKNPSPKKIAEARSRMINTDYIFLDEVSMLSCRDLYRISAQLARIYNCYDRPFGGVNMIFAGDFGQLPPPIGGERVALYSRFVGLHSTSLKAQEEAMGRALWHQVTSVVILRQNMRQISNSDDDDKFRRALSNMRYKACNEDDINFLKSKITSSLPGRTSISDPQFTQVSIITARNNVKDEINRLGCIKYAKMTGQSLTDFYSQDCLHSSHHPQTTNKHKLKALASPPIPYALQNELWHLPHSSANKHIPGKLSLCLGMPIIIKYNEATELCITNGQEATVAGWESSMNTWKLPVLDTLFVRLTNPPSPILLNNLDPNIIPLTRTERTITCKLRNNKELTISRSQVEILPNFAMTDYASQGKTRKYNVVDLSLCRSHQAYYTALSRSASAEGTLILQNFDEHKITGKASGALRQEFRDVELLDEITKSKYIDILSDQVSGDTRHSLIKSYRSLKGDNYVPSLLHPALKWTGSDPMFYPPKLPPASQNMTNTGYVPTDSQSPPPPYIPPNDTSLTKQPKRKAPTLDISEVVKKKPRSHPPHSSFSSQELFTWHLNSCAYDSFFGILYSLWFTNPNRWTQEFTVINPFFLGQLAQNFHQVANQSITINNARDNLRHILSQTHPDYFPWGQFVTLDDLLYYTLQTSSATMQSELVCQQSHSTIFHTMHTFLISITHINGESIQSWLTSPQESTYSECVQCQSPRARYLKLLYPLPVIIFEFPSGDTILNNIITIPINNEHHEYSLKGVIYHGSNHFTSRIISPDNVVWYHDGMTTGPHIINEGPCNSLNLMTCRNRNACAAIYALHS